MLIQCEYKAGDYTVKASTTYYQGVKISPLNPTPIWSVGECEIYIFPAVFPLRCAWLIVFQSRFPVFYECNAINLEGEKIMLHLTDGSERRIKPLRDGVHDRLIVDTIYKV